MDKIFLNSQVLIYLISEGIAFIVITISSYYALLILKGWSFESFTQKQFELEQKLFLQSTLIKILLFIKTILLIYFVYTIDALAILIPGAMCAAGVISANSYGLDLLFIKLALIFFLLLWDNINTIDIEAKNYPAVKLKSWLNLFIFTLFIVELFLDINYFSNINVNLPVSCCSALFGQLEGQNPLPFHLNIPMLLTLFYLLFVSTIIFLLSRMHIFIIISTTLFLFIAYYSVVYFFGTYIYELPTHKCPFCMMQKEYYYIGYFIWGFLFLGSFLALIYAFIALLFKKELNKALQKALIFLSLFVLLSSFYVAKYYYLNGVLL